MNLPSGLPNIVADNEPISRFLTSKSHFNSTSVKPNAYMPNKKDGKLSVARHSADPLSESKRIAKDFNLSKAIGVAVIRASCFREEDLDFDANEPPLRHADVVKWPWKKHDPEIDKAKQREKAAVLAQEANKILY